MATMRYFALKQLPRGLDEETGERLFFAEGDEIPRERFGSPNSLHAAINAKYIAAVPVLSATDAPRTPAEGIAQQLAPPSHHKSRS